MKFRVPILRVALGMAMMGAIPPAWGCATCFGASDAPMAQGMNAGILFLLGVVGFVLSGLGVFFVMLGRRSAAATRAREAVLHAAISHEQRPTGFDPASKPHSDRHGEEHPFHG